MAYLPLPYQRFEFHTPLEPSGVIGKLTASIASPGGNWLGGGGRWLAGRIDGASFELSIRRKLFHQNSFLPRLRGRIMPATRGGSIVAGSLSMHPLTTAFIVLVCMLIPFACVSARWRSQSERYIAPFLVFGFCYALSTAAFTYEAAEARDLLAAIIEAKPGPDRPEWLDE